MQSCSQELTEGIFQMQVLQIGVGFCLWALRIVFLVPRVFLPPPPSFLTSFLAVRNCQTSHVGERLLFCYSYLMLVDFIQSACRLKAFSI